MYNTENFLMRETMKKVAFIYPGQGSQKIGMGEDFFNSSSKAKEIIQSASDAVGIDFEKLMFSENENLGKTEFTQPAILLVSAVANTLLKDSLDIKPEFTLGHSLGEFSALNGAGVLSINDGVKLVNKRGKLMQQDCSNIEAGMMVVLGLGDLVVEDICERARINHKKVWAANYNSEGQIVVAGLKPDLKELESVFKDAGAKRAMLLDMSVASHCPLLADASNALKPDLEEMLSNDFTVPVVSNVTAKKYNTKSEAIDLLVGQLVLPVQYKQSILRYDDEVDLYIELGGGVLKGINRKITKKPTLSITDMKSLEAVISELSS